MNATIGATITSVRLRYAVQILQDHVDLVLSGGWRLQEHHHLPEFAEIAASLFFLWFVEITTPPFFL